LLKSDELRSSCRWYEIAALFPDVEMFKADYGFRSRYQV
jgi:hypothetical protein